MKTLIAVLAFVTFIAAPAFIEPAAARSAGRDASQSGQNHNGYYRGILWRIGTGPTAGKIQSATGPTFPIEATQ